LDGIGRSAARFDFAKLENLNGHYLRATPDAEIVGRLKALLPELPNGAALAERVGEKGWRKLKRLCRASSSVPRCWWSCSTVSTISLPSGPSSWMTKPISLLTPPVER